MRNIPAIYKHIDIYVKNRPKLNIKKRTFVQYVKLRSTKLKKSVLMSHFFNIESIFDCFTYMYSADSFTFSVLVQFYLADILKINIQF